MGQSENRDQPEMTHRYLKEVNYYLPVFQDRLGQQLSVRLPVLLGAQLESEQFRAENFNFILLSSNKN